MRRELFKRIPNALPHAPNAGGYDLAYRPAVYWDQPVASLHATVLPEHARAMGEAGLTGLPPGTQRRLEAVHPAFMGGAYLPPTLDWEVEVARARLASATSDVVSFRARPGEGGGIEYRVVEEYGDEGAEYDFEPSWSREPLTFGEMVLLVASAQRIDASGERWPPLVDLGESYGQAGFATFSSVYYPDLRAFFAEEGYRRSNGIEDRDDEA